MKKLALLALLCAPVCAFATPTTYTLDINGGSATAIGTITTDGTLGVLTTNDIVSYAITVSADGTSDAFTSTGGYYVIDGSDVTATASGLFYNFADTTNDNFFGIGDPAANNYVCFSGVGECNDDGFQGTQIAVDDMVYDGPGATSNTEIAAATSAVTPEPSSLMLLGTGLLGGVATMRRRFVRP